MEKTLVIIKPDAMQRGLVGDIVSRFERVGLRLAGAKMLTPSKKLLDEHYPASRKEFVVGMGQKTLENYKELGIDTKKEFGTDDPAVLGEMIRKWQVDFMRSGAVLAMVWEGPHAIEVVRKLVGFTLPQKAQPGTIRGDHSFDSSYLGNTQKRPIRNLVHASGDKEEADFEVGLWFSESELHEYDNIHQKHMNG